jgi:hypothetical protein
VSGATRYILAPGGSTGNVTGNAVDASQASGPVALQFVAEVAGTTPTVTYKFQGSLDGLNWYDVYYLTDASDTAAATARTATAVGAQVSFLDSGNSSRNYSKFRLVTSANTNVTFRAELYVFSDTDL